MRRPVGSAADQHLLIDTRASGHLLSAPQGFSHFLQAARAAAAEVIVLDPLYSTHDQDENDTRSMAALCQSLLRLREATKAALIVVHHVRKSITREEVGSAFRGSSALHAVGDSYLLLTKPSPQFATLEVALPVPLRASRSRRACCNSIRKRCGSPLPGRRQPGSAVARKKVEQFHVTSALAGWDRRPATTNCASKSCSKRNVPNAPRNWR